jgi:hypothetical protein
MIRVTLRHTVVQMPGEGYAPAVSTVLLAVAVACIDVAQIR